MNKIVNKNDLTNAQYAKQIMKPAFDALQKINAQSVGCDNDAYEKIKSFNTWLGGFVLQADDVISRAQEQYEDRPLALIHSAASRLNQIPQAIELEKATLRFKVQAYESKVEELIKQSFTRYEVNNIIQPVGQAEIDASNAVITSLQSEAKAIELFLGDAPRFDIELLKSTAIYPAEIEDKAA